MKPSETQRLVLSKMADGWTLRVDRSMVGVGAWLHRGGLGNAREIETIKITTFRALRRGKLVETQRDKWPWRTYQLTDAGRKAVRRKT